MKKNLIRSFAILLCAVVMMLPVSCTSQRAFNISKTAYEKINEAYKLVNEFSVDVYESWYLGINKKAPSIMSTNWRIFPTS